MDVKNFMERTPYFELSHTSRLIYNFENKAFTTFTNKQQRQKQ